MDTFLAAVDNDSDYSVIWVIVGVLLVIALLMFIINRGRG